MTGDHPLCVLPHTEQNERQATSTVAECPECGWEGTDGMGCEWLFGYLSEGECGNCHSELRSTE